MEIGLNDPPRTRSILDIEPLCRLADFTSGWPPAGWSAQPRQNALPFTAEDPRSDEDLVALVNQGDTKAFEALYRRHRDWVANLAARFTGDHALALDVLQETFLYF